jgi:two-component system, OmpR family, sensor kinase
VSRRSIQFRSVVAAALAILLALVVVGVGVDLLVARHLHRSLDQSLRQRAVEVAQLSASAPALLTTPGALDSPGGGSAQLSVEVVDRHGRIVTRSLSLGGRVLPTRGLAHAAIAQGRTAYSNARLGGERLRVYAAPLADFGGQAAGGAVVVAASTSGLRETLASLRLFVLGSALVAAALAASAVAVLMRRALRPLGELADAASEIERTGDPRRRLPQPVAADEVGRLGATLNAMLASLERARDAERRFLADASHELRTPLTALRGNVAYLTRHGASPDLVEELERDAERLARLADDLLVLSREEAAERPAEEVQLDELARAVAKADPAVEAVTGGSVAVRGDRAALERALANLVQNARSHGPVGGRITVVAAQVDGLAQLSVRDRGSGLQPDEAERAFERFWRGDRSGPGSGLGLAIVRATAERHGGRAYADGACFTIELPALRELSESSATTKGESPKGSP